jgi:hypothetical protein
MDVSILSDLQNHKERLTNLEHRIEILERQKSSRYIPPNLRPIPKFLVETCEQLDDEDVKWTYSPYGTFDYIELDILNCNDFEFTFPDGILTLYFGGLGSGEHKAVELEHLDTARLSSIKHIAANNILRLNFSP